MSISLLKPCGSDVCTGNVDEKTIYNLSVDKLFKYICADTRKRKYFLDEISKIYCDESVIEFRREILNDFLNFDGLYEELCSVYSAFDDLRLSIKSGLKPDNRMDFSYDSVISSRKNELRVYSLSLKRTLYFVKAVKELLTKHKTDSKGLNELLFECSKIVDKDAFDSLITLCSKYEYISERGLLGFKYTLTPNMRIDNFELIDHKYINVSRNERKKNRLKSLFVNRLFRIIAIFIIL